MLNTLKTFLGIGSGISWIAYAVVFGLGVAAGAGPSIWIEETRIDGFARQAQGAEAQRAAAEDKLTTMTANRDSLQRSVDQYRDTLDREHAEQNTIDAAARATKLQQAVAVTENANRLQAAKDAANSYLQQLKDQVHARPIVVSQVVRDGWDPVVVAGMQRLRCEQLAGNHGEDPAGCRVPADLPAGGSRLAGDPAGAGDYRPTAEQQLDFLNDAWRIHSWGLGCFDDKRAIAASQKAGPVSAEGSAAARPVTP